MSPLRIALVITELEVGGAEQCLVRLATGLDRTHFTPVVYSLAPPPKEGKDQLVRALNKSGIEIHFLGARRWWHFRRTVRELANRLRQQQPQIVQTFLFHANIAGLLAARQAKVPHVLLGVRVADPTWWRGRLERWTATQSSGVVCVSQAVADFCRSTQGLPGDKLIVIPNGIDVDRLSQIAPVDVAALGITRGRKLLAFIGRLDRQKDPHWLLKIAEAALPQLPDHDLVFVGDGRQRNELEAEVKQLSLQKRVHVMGWRADAQGILAASQLLLLTSRHEGMPNVVLEAMAMGKPVIATRAEGVLELLSAQADEQTADWGDTGAFVQKLVALAQDPVRCQHLGRLNQASVREQFSEKAMLEAYARLYERLAGS